MANQIQRFFPTPDQLEEIQFLWEETETTCLEIALRFGTTKGTLMGIGHRAGWTSFNAAAKGEPSPTLHDRLDAIWAKFNATLAECDKLMKISNYKARGIFVAAS